MAEHGHEAGGHEEHHESSGGGGGDQPVGQFLELLGTAFTDNLMKSKDIAVDVHNTSVIPGAESKPGVLVKKKAAAAGATDHDHAPKDPNHPAPHK